MRDDSEFLPLVLSALALFRAGMATVIWSFGPSGFAVGVTSRGANGESEVNGDMPATGLNICFRRLNVGGPIQSTTTTDSQGNTTRVVVSPLAVRAVISLADDGHIDANWVVDRNGVSGKGIGKGLGKNTTG